MTTLTLAEAVLLVRKNLDEIGANGSVMFGAASDNVSLDQTIKRSLPEAVNHIHLTAPVELLDWEDEAVSPAGITSSGVDDETRQVLTFTLPQNSDFLRLVSFKTKDSQVVVTKVHGSASAEGRKQANRHIRGRYDRPRLIMEQGSASAKTPTFRYYSLREPYTAATGHTAAGDNIDFLRIIKEQQFDRTLTDSQGYDISYRVRQNIIDYLTALTMQVCGYQGAELFIQKANNFPLI